MSDSNGLAFGGVQASSEAEMRAFDSLPPDVRELLNYASTNYSAVQIAAAPPVVGGESVYVYRPNGREALVAKIAEIEAAIPPLKQPARTKVAHATLRPVARPRMFVARSLLERVTY